MKNKSLLFCILLVSLSGCAALKTITVKPGDKKTEEATGIPYFLPKNFVEIKVTRTAKTENNIQYIEYMMEAKPILIPDPDTRFILKHEKNFMASDRLCVARSTTGLLQSVQFATDDKTDEILVKVAELAAKVAKTVVVPPSGFLPADAERGATKIKDGIVSAVAIGDPANPDKLTEQIRVVLKEVKSISISFDGNKPYASSPRECRSKKTICFSTLTNVPVLLTGDDGGGGNFNAATTVPLVDFKHVGKLRIDRPFLVDQVTKLGFTDGVLTHMAFKRPSAGLALASLPLDILDAILAVPANFFSTALSGMFSDQKTLLTQQKELADLQQQLRTVQQKTPPSVPGTPAESDTFFKLDCTPQPVK
jgi:hypothetical protein